MGRWKEGTRLAGSAALVTAALMLGAADAHALKCGKAVMKDVTLKQDLLNCPDDGLFVGAAGITIDLNGHRIDGVNAAGTNGILSSGQDDVVIEGPGRITGFDSGISFQGATTNGVVRGVAVKSSGTPGDSGRGIVVGQFSSRTEIRDNRVVNTQGSGITLQGERNKIIGNEIKNSADSPFVDSGIWVLGADTDNNLVRGNEITVPQGNGIQVSDASGTRIVNNELRRNDESGVVLYNEATETKIRGNIATKNLRGIWIRGDEVAAGSGNQVFANRTHRNLIDGITIDHAEMTDIADNRANYNQQWGIRALSGVNDLGGNKASGNGVGQCTSLSVTCN